MKLNRYKLAALLLSLLFIMPLAAQAQRPDEFKHKYKLSSVLVLSRHNIRSPMSGSGSALDKVTPHKWFAWTSKPAELSLRGGALETSMGQYFRKWLEQEGLIPDNWLPQEGETRFYANSRQRTIATAQYFADGFLPVANVSIEHKCEIGGTDPVFKPKLTHVNDTFREQALRQLWQLRRDKGLGSLNEELKDECRLIEDVLDYQLSPMRREGLEDFTASEPEIVLNQDKQPDLKGPLSYANQACDALILQYYEEPDSVKAAFGKELTFEDWAKIGSLKDSYYDILFSAPLIAVNTAHPMLQEMNKELSLKDRRFTFLCGHDTNLCSVLAALGAEDYSLPQAIEKKTPIGAKLVIEKWAGKDGTEYASLSLVYQTVEQLRNMEILSLDNPPAVYPIKLKGLKENADGLYLLSDLQERFKETIEAYDKLP
ncbi:histidine-type phosphatase [bacterium]|nr:histidine-type phosphatase [bacterium]